MTFGVFFGELIDAFFLFLLSLLCFYKQLNKNSKLEERNHLNTVYVVLA
jgi:hypothetical protein